MNVIGNALRKQLSAFDSKGAADEKYENKVVENQRFNPATERWSFKNLTQDDPKRCVLFSYSCASMDSLFFIARLSI